MILEILADPVVPTSKLGSGINTLWVQYGMIAVVCGIIAVFVMKAFRMLMAHPVIFVILVIIALAAVGIIKVAIK